MLWSLRDENVVNLVYCNFAVSYPGLLSFIHWFLGNGPNALSLSFILSGNVPYYIPRQHPNAILDQKLCEDRGKSLLDSVSEFMVNFTYVFNIQSFNLIYLCLKL